MKTLYELLHDKNKYPKGNIYKKIIKGKTYFYHQYRNNGSNVTKKLSENDAILISNKINERKIIEQQIKEILSHGNRSLTLSNFAKEYTGYLMSGDKVVAVFNHGAIVSEPTNLCPLVVKRSHSLIPFLKSRCIDCSRTNSRLLRKALNISISDETIIPLCTYAACITDNYWFKPKHSKLKYKDIAFDNDVFFDTSLKGIITIYSKNNILTPELTTNGSYEKGWRNEYGKWWLYKKGSRQEIYSEMFYSRLFEHLKLPTAHYEIDGEYIKTLDFSNGMNFEPLSSIVDGNEDILFVYNNLNKISHKIALDYLRLYTFDVILNNVDRHNENCGIMRSRRNGKILSLAPNYDDNLSLISRTSYLDPLRVDGFLNMFLKTIKNNDVIKKALKEIKFPLLSNEIIVDVDKEIDLNVPIEIDTISQYILFRYKKIMDEINK